MRYLLIFVSTIFIFGCSATPKYLSEPNSISKLRNADLSAYEHVEILPKTEDRNSRNVEYDLSTLDKSLKILAAVVEINISSESVMARSLGGAEPAELAPIIKPIPYMGSRAKAPNLDFVRAFYSDIEYKANTLSMLERVGGTGGKATYNSKGPGVYKYDTTQHVQYFLNKNKPFTFSITTEVNSARDLTIFSNSYIISSIEFGTKNGSTTKLTVYYE